MECAANCWGLISPPSLPPPPPIPPFLPIRLNFSINCDLCDWAGVSFGSSGADLSSESNRIHLSSLLILVGLISAGVGAGIMAAILSLKRIRGGFNTSATSAVRHLARKEHRIGLDRRLDGENGNTSTDDRFRRSSLTENTYCDGPYSASDKDGNSSHCNVYAELQEPRQSTNAWNRPRLTPLIENCYLELADLPSSSQRYEESGGRPPSPPPPLPAWYPDIGTPNYSTTNFYSDLDLTRRGIGT